MCTVVFIPSQTGSFFASLRDESPKRPSAFSPVIKQKGGIKFLAPIDPSAGGTWLGLNELGSAIILLNGGFENHQKATNYQRSRGLIVSELLVSEMPVIDWQLIDLTHIEPFTLIVWSDALLFQLVWDGSKKHRIRLDATKSHLFSSATLYNNEAKARREDWFNNWMAMEPPISKLSFLRFFKSIDDKENGFIINRNNEMATLSYTFIEMPHQEQAAMSYYDLANFTFHSQTLSLLSNATHSSFI
jgi:Transport and Golgi organisation 2